MCSSRRSGSRCARSPGLPSSAPAAGSGQAPRGNNPAMNGSTRFVYDFDEPAEGGRGLLGGKGVGLAEMTSLGLPVPAGFTITTDACRAYMATRDLPEGLDAEVAAHIRRLEEKTGKRFGDADD